MTSQRKNAGDATNTINAVIGIVGMVLALVLMFYIARFIYTILWYLSPVFIIGALILDKNAVINFGKWMINLFQRNMVAGLISAALGLFAFPLVSLFLLGKAFFTKRMREVGKEQERRQRGEYVSFEELDSEPLELRELEKEQRRRSKTKSKSRNDYDNFFDPQ